MYIKNGNAYFALRIFNRILCLETLTLARDAILLARYAVAPLLTISLCYTQSDVVKGATTALNASF